LLFASIATAACGWSLCEDDDVQQMGRRVQMALPLGSTPAQVTKFLDDIHIENGHGGWEFYDTHRYDGLEQIEGRIRIGLRDTPAANLLFFFRDSKLVEWWVQSDCGAGCYSMRANGSMYRPASVSHRCYDP